MNWQTGERNCGTNGAVSTPKALVMKTLHLTAEIAAGLRAVSIPLPGEQDRFEVRLLTAYLMMSFINDLIGPISYIFNVPGSMLHRVASMSGTGDLIGFGFVFAACLAIPHMFALLCYPKFLTARLPRKLAVLAAVVVTLMWSYLAVLAMPLDVGPLSILYARQAIEAVGLAFLLAVSLNSQQLRQLQALRDRGAVIVDTPVCANFLASLVARIRR